MLAPHRVLKKSGVVRSKTNHKTKHNRLLLYFLKKSGVVWSKTNQKTKQINLATFFGKTPGVV